MPDMKKINMHLLTSRSILAFHLAAQENSFTKAADTLNVSQPAISHGVRQLEERLGVELFERNPQGVVLTEIGEKLARRIQRGLAEIQQGLEETLSHTQPEKITLLVSTSVASHWLMPRIARFKHLYPEVQLHCITQDTDQGLQESRFDLCIPLGLAPESGFQRWQFAEEVLTPVCSPEFAYRHQLQHLSAINDIPLIHLEERYNSRYNWQHFFDDCSLSPHSARGDETYNDYSIVLQAAMEGQGLALGWQHIVGPLIQQGKLVAPFEQQIATNQPFHIIAPEHKPLNPNAKALLDWLLNEMQ